MSDSEDLLGDDLGDQSLADYNLGNEEEEQLLADDYDTSPQNVPASVGGGYTNAVEIEPSEYSSREMEYAPPPMVYQPIVETECVVPNLTVEVPNLPPQTTYAPVEPRHYEAEHAVPPAIPAAPIESPQIVPSEVAIPNGEGGRERFISERPVGAQRTPQVRDIPDSLDKVVIPRGYARGRTTWRAAHFNARFQHPYRRNNMHRSHFNQRNSFSHPQQVIRPNIPKQIIRQEIRPEMIRPEIRQEMIRPDIRPEIIRPDTRTEMIRPDERPEIMRPDIRPEMIRPDIRSEMIRPEIRPDMMRPDGPPEMLRPDLHPEIHPEIIHPDIPNLPRMGPEISPERPILPDMSFRPPLDRPSFDRPPFQQFRYQYRPDERPMFGPVRPNFDRPMYPFPRQFSPRFGPPMREIVANSSHIPQVTIRQVPDKMSANEPEVRMLPVPLPPHIPAGRLAGKKVLINPHFKGNFQPIVDGLPAYIPTRIQKSPPLSPTNIFGPIKDIDDAAERFIAEQRNALARAATRKFPRRSPQRYIENTTIEIENELAARPRAPARRRSDDDDLLRRQEEFISANRAGLRRRMRSPSPPPARRSPSPRRPRPEPPRERNDEDSEYKRRVREQESLRSRVLRAKEVRRRKNAQALHLQLQDRDRENQDKLQPPLKEKENLPTTTKETEPADKPEPVDKPTSTEETKPDTTRNTPERKSSDEAMPKDKAEGVKETERVRERSPIKAKDDEVNSTCEGLTPPGVPPSRTPPWAPDDDLDLILGDIDCILSDEDDSGRFKDKGNKSDGPAPAPAPAAAAAPVADLRARLLPKAGEARPPRQKIVFADDRDDRRRKEKTPPRRAVVSSTKADDSDAIDKKSIKTKANAELLNKSRQRITFDNQDKETDKEKDDQEKPPAFSNRRVILQRNAAAFPRGDADRTQPHAGIFSRAVRVALGEPRARGEPRVEVASDDDAEPAAAAPPAARAAVANLPPGMTGPRLRALAGADVQSLVLDKEERSADITFKTTAAAETFRRKFNNKMVAASRLSVSLH